MRSWSLDSPAWMCSYSGSVNRVCMASGRLSPAHRKSSRPALRNLPVGQSLCCTMSAKSQIFLLGLPKETVWNCNGLIVIGVCAVLQVFSGAVSIANQVVGCCMRSGAASLGGSLKNLIISNK